MAAPRRSQRGFTLLEMLFVIGFGGALIVTATQLLQSTNSLSEQDRLEALAESTHVRSLEYITNLLRNADVASLEGFDEETGIASSLQFFRPTGTTREARILGPEETLVWRPAPRPVPGVASPGAVWLVSSTDGLTDGLTDEWVAADRVPLGGFTVVQEGRTLVVRLATYQPVEGTTAVHVTGSATVSLRN